MRIAHDGHYMILYAETEQERAFCDSLRAFVRDHDY